MLLKHGKPRAQQWQAKNFAKVVYESDLLECLAHTLNRENISRLLVEQAKRL